MFIDMDKIEILDGLIVFNPWIMTINLILLLGFFYSWYNDYKKTGWKLNVWHLSLFMGIGIPFFLLYPFCASYMNVFSTGNAYIDIGKYVELAYMITITGYICILIGGKFATINISKAERYDFFEKILYTNICRGFALKILMVACIVFFLLSGVLSFSAGMPFNGRGWFLTNPAYRFIGNFFSSLYPLVFLYMGLRILTNKKKIYKDIILLVLSFISGLCWGSRGVLFGSLVSVLLYWLYLHKNVSLKKIIFYGVVVIIGVMMMAELRSGESLGSNFFTERLLLNIFYGNSFSDCRDFAWMLTGFSNDMYRLGATYIAGITAFLPSSLFPFRHEYAVGIWSLELAGIADPTGEHPGLRGGMFFEIYLNFSIIGVMIWGTLYGWFLRKADLWTRFFIDTKHDSINAYIKQYPMIIIGAFSITAGMFNLYVFFALHALCLILNMIPYILNHSVYRKKELN